MSWSSGKDSALALAEAREQYDVVGLLTTADADADRVAMHGVRRELLEAQASALGLPLHVVALPWPCPNDVYERLMRDAVVAAVAEGVEVMVFGDLFLADIRAYREAQLAGSGLRPDFPLWGRPTDVLARDMLAAGIDAVLTCVDVARLPASYAGRVFDAELLAELPDAVDACGENGEFHTFVRHGPGFAHPIPTSTGEVVVRDGFAYADLLPAT
jgi:uncharacterized protein (TIGR00290 family)